jgi:26S proteasome regulatory subunit N12
MSLRLIGTSHSYRHSTMTTGQKFLDFVVPLRLILVSISSVLPPSKREYPIRGLNLIRLLIQNRIADFHTTLESLPLPADEIALNPYISHPVNLERWLMEGSYSKVWNAREEAPAEEHKFFVDSLIVTIRSVSHFGQAKV